MNTTESSLNYFYRLLPRVHPRRGIINLGSTVLKALFGTVTIADELQLHQTLDHLKSRNADIVHSLSDQVTYIKGLDHVARVNAEAKADMSTVVKDFIIQSYDKLYEHTRDIVTKLEDT